MGHVGVPWAVGGGVEDQGARIPAQVLRQLAAAANEGQEGVVGPLDCRLMALSTPGPYVRVMPGLWAINSKVPTAKSEQYTGYTLTEDVVPIAPTDASGGRSDLVIIRVEDPFAEPTKGWATPGDVANGPYVHTRVIQGINPNTVKLGTTSAATDAAILCGRVDIAEPNTGTITQGMIKDLRSVIGLGARATEELIEQQIWTESTHCDGGDMLLREHQAWRNWPAQASWQIPIPSWATGVDIIQADVSNALVTRFDGTGSNVYAYVWGEMRLSIGGEVGTPTVFDHNVPMITGGGGARAQFCVGGTQPISAAKRGTVQTVRLQARMNTGPAATGHVEARPGTYARLLLNFKKNPSYE